MASFGNNGLLCTSFRNFVCNCLWCWTTYLQHVISHLLWNWWVPFLLLWLDEAMGSYSFTTATFYSAVSFQKGKKLKHTFLPISLFYLAVLSGQRSCKHGRRVKYCWGCCCRITRTKLSTSKSRNKAEIFWTLLVDNGHQKNNLNLVWNLRLAKSFAFPHQTGIGLENPTHFLGRPFPNQTGFSLEKAAE